jgi:hypothetical protein
LLGDPVPGTVYGSQLVKANPPEEYETFAIEKILKQFKDPVTKEKMATVKYLGYPSKFNQDIPVSRIVGKRT